MLGYYLRNCLTALRPVRCLTVRNYWRRRDAFSELSSAMQLVENYMREADKEMNRIFGDLQRSSPVKLPRLFQPFDFGRTREVPVISNENDGESYKLELDVEGMQPEDIKVTLKDHQLNISAKKDEKRADGSRFVREYCYQYDLPKELNPDTIRSILKDGVLTIEAPLLRFESKEIPINVESGQKSGNSDDTSKSRQ